MVPDEILIIPTTPESEEVQISRPVQIIRVPSFPGSKPEFLHDNLQRIVSRLPGDMPVFTVSISGECRSGKSFLLNMMATYLQYFAEHSTDEGWESSEMEIRGGGWAQSAETITQGIWMWNEPIILDIINRQAAVLLMDCGSAGIGQSDPIQDMLILSLSLHLSQVQLLNTHKTLKSWTLQILQIVTGKISPSSVQNSLIIVIRDWEADDRFGAKDKMLLNLMQETESAEVRRDVDAITKAFTHETCFCLPLPGREVTAATDVEMRQSDSKPLTVRALGAEMFRTSAKELFRLITTRLWDNKDRTINGIQYLAKFREMEKQTINWMAQKFVRITMDSQTKQEIIRLKGRQSETDQMRFGSQTGRRDTREERDTRDVFRKVRESYDNKINELVKTYKTGQKSRSDLQLAVDSIARETRDQFLNSQVLVEYGNSETIRKYLKKLEDIFQEDPLRCDGPIPCLPDTNRGSFEIMRTCCPVILLLIAICLCIPILYYKPPIQPPAPPPPSPDVPQVVAEYYNCNYQCSMLLYAYLPQCSCGLDKPVVIPILLPNVRNEYNCTLQSPANLTQAQRQCPVTKSCLETDSSSEASWWSFTNLF